MLKVLQSMIRRLYARPIKLKHQPKRWIKHTAVTKIGQAVTVTSTLEEPLILDCLATKLSDDPAYQFGWSGSNELHIFDVDDKIYCCTLIMQGPKNTSNIDWFGVFRSVTEHLRLVNIEWINTKL